jgi:hypothetical protein
MIDGMRMDLVKSRYETYDELYEYCYRVAGTVALMSMPVMGVDPAYKVRGQHMQVRMSAGARVSFHAAPFLHTSPNSKSPTWCGRAMHNVCVYMPADGVVE